MSEDNTVTENRYTKYENKHGGKTTLELIQAMHEAQAEKERIEEILKEAQAEFDFLRLIAVPKKFEDEGIENMKVDGIGRVSLTGDMYVSIAAGQKDAAFEYFRDIGKASLITESINSSTLKATVKAMMKAGEEIPEDLIKVTPFTRASITKR